MTSVFVPSAVKIWILNVEQLLGIVQGGIASRTGGVDVNQSLGRAMLYVSRAK
jgi:hypothetical protein